MERSAILLCCGTLLLAPAGATARQPPEAHTVVRRVLALLPQVPAAVKVVTDTDPILRRLGHSPEHVDGFVVPGDSNVYLRAEGSMFRLALKGPGPADYALAAIVWHEIAHQRGASEPEAQLQEENLWATFVAAGQVDRTRGIKYLQLLKQRRVTSR
jgi:hypothetical protein